jgi:hypothetical protein
MWAACQMQTAANDHQNLKKLLQGFDPWVKHGRRSKLMEILSLMLPFPS